MPRSPDSRKTGTGGPGSGGTARARGAAVRAARVRRRLDRSVCWTEREEASHARKNAGVARATCAPMRPHYSPPAKLDRGSIMLRVNPFAALRPNPNVASEVASVPYDVVDTEEARRLAEGRPL